jgi:predicted RNA-binding Zn-ribbon protein involved in translation (DUF1610 family)
MNNQPITPHWAPKVSCTKVRRIYEADALGIRDEELIDEVGYALYARCQSILAVTEAHHGKVGCPQCGSVILREDRDHEDSIIRCAACGWQIPWVDYHRSYQGKQLYGANAVGIFHRFYERFPALDSASEKMLAIDQLLHEFHTGLKEYGRPVAANLLEGKLKEVIKFLDDRTYSSKSSDGLAVSQSGWRERLHSTSWAGNLLEQEK